MTRAMLTVSFRHAIGQPKVPSWPYVYELLIEMTRIVISDVIVAGDVERLLSDSEEDRRLVRRKIRAVQELLSFPGGVPAVGGSRVVPTTVGDLGAEWIFPAASAEAALRGADGPAELPPSKLSSPGAILFLHGGAYLVCGVATHRRLASWLAAEAELPVLAVDYRLMPEHTFSDIVSDGAAAFERLLAAGLRPEQVALAGDSAGGHLAICLAMSLKERGQAPGAVVAFSPWIDPLQEGESTLESWQDFEDVCYLGKALDGIGVVQACFQDHPFSSLLRHEALASLEGFPPILIQAGGRECLYSEIEEFASRAAELRGDSSGVKLEVWEDEVHVFQFFADVSEPAREALRSAGSFLRGRLAPPPEGRRGGEAVGGPSD
mmetsp:Transcript_25260/g.60112  ORF Transcript_25260/g.60112 Transcript_25260/m.60112 type:complete len:378 (-) Transcript_25260:66-1199(-)